MDVKAFRLIFETLSGETQRHALTRPFNQNKVMKILINNISFPQEGIEPTIVTSTQSHDCVTTTPRRHVYNKDLPLYNEIQ